MTTAESSAGRLSPDEAFAALGNEHRVRILRELGAADGPLAFSELYDRVEIADSAQFNYHLGKLVGHFVHKLEGTYALARPGERVVEAILSGAVTDDPSLDRTPVEGACSECGDPLAIQWRNGSVELFCSSCEGRWSRSWGRVGAPESVSSGYLGRFPFPPAGLEGRSPTGLLRAAYIWSILEQVAVAAGLCPRCGATVETDVSVCPDHEPGDGPCPTCGSNARVRLSAACTNCIYAGGAAAVWGLLGAPELYEFFFDQGLNPLVPEDVGRVEGALHDYEERVRSTDPLRVEFRFRIEDSLTVTADESLTVLDSSRGDRRPE